MVKNLLFLFISILTIPINGQNIQVDQSNSYNLFGEVLKKSKDIKYGEIVEQYNDYISKHPDNIAVKVYRCRFIGSAYYDEYDDYDTNYEETEKCIEELYSQYPENPEVLLYKLEYAYGEEKKELLNETISLYYSDKDKWSYNQVASLFEIGAYYYVEENDYKAIDYAERAEKFSDSLDLSILITNAQLREGNRDKALESILFSLYRDGEAWQLQEKGELLIELDQHDKAFELFERAKLKDSLYTSNTGLYKIFVENRKYEIARDYLIKDTIAEWNKSSGLQKLLEHDISFSSPEVALNSYRRMQEESYFDDFLGIKRLKIFFKDPFNAWTISELSHIIILVLLIAFLFLIPYIWILPIYSSKKYFKLKTSDANNLIKVDWSLKHFWLISFMYLLCQLLLVLIFYYEDYINFIFDISYSSAIEETLESEIVSANTIIVFCILLLLCTLLLLNRQRLKFVLNSNIRYLRIITLSIAFVIFNAIILKILGSFVNLTEAPSLIETLSIREELKSLISQYGLALSVLIAAVAVPFYEEIIFRGIILSSTEKHVGFKWANGIQATLFAIVHFNLNLFIFYFIFGLVTGYVVKRTNGLLTGIAFHAVNNFLVLLAIYYISKLTLQI